MRKENLGAFFKGKGFYAALVVGTVAIFAVGILNTNIISDNSNELAKNPSSQIAENAKQEGRENQSSVGDTTDFTSENEILENYNLDNEILENKKEGTDDKANEESTNNSELSNKESMSQEILEEEIVNQQLSEQEIAREEVENQELSEQETIAEEVASQQIAEQEIVKNETADLIEIAQVEAEPIKKVEAEEKVAEVLSKESQISSLNFSEEDGLLWPVQGNVILEYSMDKPIYFKTLEQYKCNSAIAIEAKEKTEVFSVAKCVITDISNVDETGITVKASIGNDYEVIYGQLLDVQVEVGDIIEEGDIIGMVGAPTKYYAKEGSHLYFKVLAGNEPINPLLLLN